MIMCRFIKDLILDYLSIGAGILFILLKDSIATFFMLNLVALLIAVEASTSDFELR